MFVLVMSAYEKWSELFCLPEDGHGYFKRHIQAKSYELKHQSSWNY